MSFKDENQNRFHYGSKYKRKIIFTRRFKAQKISKQIGRKHKQAKKTNRDHKNEGQQES